MSAKQYTPETLAKRLLYDREYKKRPDVRARRLAALHAQPEQRRARKLVVVALRYGRLVKEPCSVCGAIRVQAHHPNGYDDAHALDIQWLCPTHHSARHLAPQEPGQ